MNSQALPAFETAAIPLQSSAPGKVCVLQINYEKSLFGRVPLFRFMQSEKHATDFLSGKIWISTLGACRRLEGSYRRDEQEGQLVHRPGLMTSDDPRFKPAIEQTGTLRIADGAKSVSIQGPGGLIGEIDSYVLCATSIYSPAMRETFGKWCVAINDPVNFCLRVLARLTERNVNSALLGRCHYIDREVHGYEVSAIPLGLRKPKLGYSEQQEVRMLWYAKDVSGPLSPFVLDCPEATRLCELKSCPE